MYIYSKDMLWIVGCIEDGITKMFKYPVSSWAIHCE
jgi:hypothetical protein